MALPPEVVVVVWLSLCSVSALQKPFWPVLQSLLKTDSHQYRLEEEQLQQVQCQHLVGWLWALILSPQ